MEVGGAWRRLGGVEEAYLPGNRCHAVSAAIVYWHLEGRRAIWSRWSCWNCFKVG